MRVLRPAASLVFRLGADVLLLLGLAAIGLWVASFKSFQVDHASGAGGPTTNDVSLRLVAVRGGLWVLHLRTHDPDAPLALGLGPPHRWNFRSPAVFDPDARLTFAQSGPRRLGFSSQTRHAERRSPTFDPVTHRRVERTLVEDERITRVPFAAIVAALIILPALRIGLAVRGRLRRSRSGTPPRWVGELRQRVVGLAALAAVPLLAFTVWHAAVTRSAERNLSWTTSWPSPKGLWSTSQVRRTLAFTRDGWEVSRTFLVNGPPVVPESATSHVVGVDIPNDLYTRAFLPAIMGGGQSSSTSPPPPSGGGGWRLLGFAYVPDDTVLSPFGAGPAGRRIGSSLLIPHWAVALIFAAVPALWVCRVYGPPRRRRDRLRRGLCPDCGYDLRATPGRCPECNWSAEVAATARA